MFLFPAQVTRKRFLTPTGVYGTVSWLINDLNRRVVVMWSAPFNFDFNDNTLAVGITDEGVVDNPEKDHWFKQMYDGNSIPGLQYERRKYNDVIKSVIFRYFISFSLSFGKC